MYLNSNFKDRKHVESVIKGGSIEYINDNDIEIVFLVSHNNIQTIY